MYPTIASSLIEYEPRNNTKYPTIASFLTVCEPRNDKVLILCSYIVRKTLNSSHFVRKMMLSYFLNIMRLRCHDIVIYRLRHQIANILTLQCVSICMAF